jgi:hypothetical protein
MQAMDTVGPSIDSICRKIATDLEIADALAASNGNSVITRLIATRNSDSSLTNRVSWDRQILIRLKEINHLHTSYLAAIALVKSLPKAHSEARAMLNKKTTLRDAISYVSAQGKELGELYGKIKSSQ